MSDLILFVKTCDEIRQENLIALIKEARGEDALAARYDCTVPHIKQMARGYKDSKSGSPKGIGDQSARKLELCMQKERGWMDHEHQSTALLAAERTATYKVGLSDEEAMLLNAYRNASEAQRGIALMWAKANLDIPIDGFSRPNGTE